MGIIPVSDGFHLPFGEHNGIESIKLSQFTSTLPVSVVEVICSTGGMEFDWNSQFNRQSV